MAQITGTKAVLWGVQPIPDNIIGIPEGAKVRFRARNTDYMRCFIKHNGEVRHYALMADTFDGPWELLPQGVNATREYPLNPRSPQAEDHRKILAML